MKVLLTGAPGTGKTSCLERLKLDVPDAVFVSETATELIKSGIDRSDNFEDLIFEYQLLREDFFDSIGNLVFYDRGLIDCFAFLSIYDVSRLVYSHRVDLDRYDKIYYFGIEQSYYNREDRPENYYESKIIGNLIRHYLSEFCSAEIELISCAESIEEKYNNFLATLKADGIVS